MKSFSRDRAISPLLSPALALLLAWGCSSTGGTSSSAEGGTSGTATGGGGSLAGGTSDPGSTSAAAGNPGSGGTTGKAGSSTSAVAGSGGGGASGGATGGGGSAKAGTTSGTTAKAGTTSTGGTANTGGTTAKGGTTSPGGATGRDAGAGVDGASSTGSTGDGGANCPTTMPEGGTTKTGKSVYGTANGLGYGIWTNGDGGSITYYNDAHAFSASWSESKNFLAHLGLDFRPGKDWTTLGDIKAEYSEVKSGTAGPWSMIGIYGWTQSPCVEWYINEDAWGRFGGSGSLTAEIDGSTYYLKTVDTTGTEGANACESGHTGTWKQMISTRKTARTCGTVTVSDHFKEWEKQGWKLGALTSVHINVEVGGGTGKIDFPLANVTTTNK